MDYYAIKYLKNGEYKTKICKSYSEFSYLFNKYESNGKIFKNLREANEYLGIPMKPRMQLYDNSIYIMCNYDLVRKIARYAMIFVNNKQVKQKTEKMFNPNNKYIMEYVAIKDALEYCKNNNITKINLYYRDKIIKEFFEKTFEEYLDKEYVDFIKYTLKINLIRNSVPDEYDKRLVLMLRELR